MTVVPCHLRSGAILIPAMKCSNRSFQQTSLARRSTKLAVGSIAWSQSVPCSLATKKKTKRTKALPHPFKKLHRARLMLRNGGKLKTVNKSSCPKRTQRRNPRLTLRIKSARCRSRKRNYREPNEIFNNYGADALRWYFFANQAPWNSINYSERAIKESIPEFLLRLRMFIASSSSTQHRRIRSCSGSNWRRWGVKEENLKSG